MGTLNNWRVLVVEDEPDGQELVKSLLDHFNIATRAVGTAEEALETLRHEHFDAVVIDLGLPVMDGMALLSAIRMNLDTAHIPCIAVTAFHTSAVKQQALDAGFNAYFPKPLVGPVFVRELNRLLSGSTSAS